MNRFVISLTTLPDRLPHIGPVIKSIVKHNPDIDRLYICLPYGNVNPKHIPKDTDIIKVVRCTDYGPITKILGCLTEEKDPETLILTLDDDVIITQNLTKIFRKRAKKYPNSALSMSGWCYGSFPQYFQLVIDNEYDVKVDWIQGVHGILYRRKFLDIDQVLEFDKDEKVLFKNDDHRISAYMETQGINRIAINRNPKDYFQDYCLCSDINPISGGSGLGIVKFWRDVNNISKRYAKKGIYYRHYKYNKSVVLIVISIVLLLTLIFIACWRYGPYSYLFRGGTLLLLLLVFYWLILWFFFSMMLEKKK